MGIRLVTSQKALDDLFTQCVKIINEKVEYNLNYLGLTCITKIRDRSGSESWYDQTGNLRSSIGYAIYSHGKKEVESAFNTVLGGNIGSQKGRQMVEKLAHQYSDTYALVVLAAMEYAEYVEAIDSKDVLASTEIYAKAEVGRYLEKALKEAEKEIQQIETRL